MGRRKPIGISEISGARTAITAVTSRAPPSNCYYSFDGLSVEIWPVLDGRICDWLLVKSREIGGVVVVEN
jgi:hypothetical protein